MRQYIVREGSGGYLIGHLGWFRQWKTDWSFDYISDLLNFISVTFISSELIWEFPEPTFEESDKILMCHIKGFGNTLTHYRYLAHIAEDKNFDTKTADLCFVYSDKENMYRVVDRPYDTFKGHFKQHFCLPCWSKEASPKYLEAFNKWDKIENEKVRTGTRYFHHLDEYEEWRNDHLDVKILSFKDISGPWSSFSYEVTYEYKNSDLFKTT